MDHIPKIVIDVIPHKKQRYNTCGDYFHKKGELHIRVSKMNSDHEFLVAIHELIEAYLTAKKGVTIQEIDEFDMKYERNRPAGDISEPGNDPSATYFTEHQFSTKIEKEIAEKLGVNWDKYDTQVSAL